VVAACFIEVHYNNFIKKKKQEKEKVMFSCKETKEKELNGLIKLQPNIDKSLKNTSM
jgi:hypothetical protein